MRIRTPEIIDFFCDRCNKKFARSGESKGGYQIIIHPHDLNLSKGQKQFDLDLCDACHYEFVLWMPYIEKLRELYY